MRAVPGRFAPALPRAPLTWRVPVDSAAPAAVALAQDAWAATPTVVLASDPPFAWQPRPDLIGSQPEDADFVVETDNDGIAHLRFGDGTLGLAPPAGAAFTARYRIGNGPAGNVGADSIVRMVLRDLTLDGVGITLRNPLPAVGGTAPETIAHARLLAPHTFRTRLARAVTAADYATLAGRDPAVQRAAAQLVWTGSWYEADVAIDPLGTEAADPALLAAIEHRLDSVRRIGHDLHVTLAVMVPIDLRIEACALPGYRRADIKAALLAAFGTGRLGAFHPDALSFGDGIYLSRIVARAQAIPGVAHVAVTRLQRLFESANGEIENGLLPLAGWEIARLDNDPNRPEHGWLQVLVQGGH
jgi:predicted phage baseplate assembly protein